MGGNVDAKSVSCEGDATLDYHASVGVSLQHTQTIFSCGSRFAICVSGLMAEATVCRYNALYTDKSHCF